MNERPADRLAIAVAQLNPIVGDIAGNLERARKARATAARDGRDIIAFSELFIAVAPRLPATAPTSSRFPSCSSPAIRPRTSSSSRRFRPLAARPSRRWRATPPTAALRY